MSIESKKKKIRRRRGVPLALRLLRWQFMLLQYLLPALAVKKAYQVWFMTRRFESPAREQRWSKGATFPSISSGVGKIHCYQWGSGPLVLLVHGWNGRGLQLGAFVEPLLQRGYQVISFDLPGHGRSDGDSTDIFQVSQVLLELQRQFSSPHAIISHSFGGTAVSYALNHGLHTHRFVSISAPLNFQWLSERFSAALRLKPVIVEKLGAMFKQRFNLDSFDVISTDYNFAKLTIPTLVVHDRDDTDVPWQHSEKLVNNLNSAELYLTSQLGHRRILYNPKVINDIVDFVDVENTASKSVSRC